MKTKKQHNANQDSIGLIIIGVGASALYTYLEWSLNTFDIQAGIVIATILLYSLITQYLINNVSKSQLKIRESEKKYRLLAENATDIIWTMDKNLNFTYFSPSIESLSGYQVDEITALALEQILTPESYQKVSALLREKLSDNSRADHNKKVVSFEYQQILKDNRIVWMEAWATFLYDEAQNPSIQCVSRDITWRKSAEDALRTANETLEQKVAERTAELQQSNTRLNDEIQVRRAAEDNLRVSENRYRAIFENTGTATVIINNESIITLSNTEFESLTGYTKAESEHKKSWLEFIEMADMEKILKFAFNTENNNPKDNLENILKNHECSFINKQGGKKNVLVSYAPIQETSESVISISDISQLKEAKKQIHHQAFHDSLTNLPNRTLFIDHLNMAIKRQRRVRTYRFAVIYLDIDRFKNINDSLGHLIGDKLLIAFSMRLRDCLREIDTLARFGGDEFVILLEDIDDPSSAIAIAERIQDILKKPFNMDGREIFTTASCGIVLDIKDYTQAEHIIRDADAAMYYAKESGKARYEVFDKKMHERALQLLHLETDLRKAVEREEFELHYQPIVSMKSGELTGFEALVRWNHPKFGMVYPDVFISTAEETGLIIPLGKWVLEKACLQLSKWLNNTSGNPHPLFMSVNISARQFAQKKLVSDIREILEKTKLPPGQLKLEITESIIMENTGIAISSLYRLKELGLHIVIDDFGTGYSSLSYLQQLPIDTLKVDRSFVMPIKKEITENRQIVEAIISLAHRLGINVIAEGVETSDQRLILSDMKCQQAQGYLFSRPMNEESADELVRNMSMGQIFRK